MYARSLSVCLFLIADPRLCGNQSVLSADVSVAVGRFYPTIVFD